MSAVVIHPGSPLIGKTLAEAGLGRDMDLTVMRVVRDKNRYLVPNGGLKLEEGDELLVEGQHNDILKIKDGAGIGLKADVKLSDPRLQTEMLQLVEVIPPPFAAHRTDAEDPTLPAALRTASPGDKPPRQEHLPQAQSGASAQRGPTFAPGAARQHHHIGRG